MKSKSQSTSKKVWGFDPAVSSTKVPTELHETINNKLIEHINKIAPHIKLSIRFRSKFCYIDSVEDGQNMPLCRLSYHGNIEAWSLSFYTYSNDKYQECIFTSGNLHGSLEDALESCSIYF